MSKGRKNKKKGSRPQAGPAPETPRNQRAKGPAAPRAATPPEPEETEEEVQAGEELESAPAAEAPSQALPKQAFAPIAPRPAAASDETEEEAAAETTSTKPRLKPVHLKHANRTGRAPGKPMGTRRRTARREGWGPRLLTAFLAGMMLVGVGAVMASVVPFTRFWLDRLPENYADRVRNLAMHGKREEAIAVALDRAKRVAYDFEPYWLAGDVAMRQSERALVQPLPAVAIAALERGLTATVRHRQEQVAVRGWNEGHALALVGGLLAKLGRTGEAAGLLRQARVMDPARAGRVLDDLSAHDSAAAAALEAWKPSPAAPDPLPGGVVWSAQQPDALEALRTPDGKQVEGTRREKTGDEGTPGGVVFTRRSNIRLAPPKDGRPRAGEPVRLHLRAKASPAYGMWPVILIKSATPGESAAGSVGAVVVDSAEWIDLAVGPIPMPAGAIDFHYYNDEYDPELKQDRNLILGAITIEPGS